MAGYFGTDAQRRLQARAEAATTFIETTPGAFQNGRMVGCDDLDVLGWAGIDGILARDGNCAFRMIPTSRVAELTAGMEKRGYRFDSWDMLMADRRQGLPAAEGILDRGLPDGFVRLDAPVEPEDAYTAALQTLMADAGVVPFSGSMLTGAIGRSTTHVIGDRNGNPVAVAHTYMPHNAYSAFREYAWGGLVSVAEAHRGCGLGGYINASIVASAFRDLGASHIYEMVSETNVPSRRMVEACGLRHDASVVSGIATAAENGRFTR